MRTVIKLKCLIIILMALSGAININAQREVQIANFLHLQYE